MTKQPLLPYAFKKIGWIIFAPVFIFWLVNLIFYDGNLLVFDKDLRMKLPAIVSQKWGGHTQFFTLIETEPVITIIIATLLISLIFIAFSRQKQEDEFVGSLRLNSWLWAAWINSALLLLADLFVYGEPFMSVVEFNLFTLLIIFIIRFHYLLYKYSRS
jgi:ABC-type polysaccharide transport system permease subunit